MVSVSLGSYDEITSFLCCRHASTSSVQSVQSKCPAEWSTFTEVTEQPCLALLCFLIDIKSLQMWKSYIWYTQTYERFMRHRSFFLFFGKMVLCLQILNCMLKTFLSIEQMERYYSHGILRTVLTVYSSDTLLHQLLQRLMVNLLSHRTTAWPLRSHLQHSNSQIRWVPWTWATMVIHYIAIDSFIHVTDHNS